VGWRVEQDETFRRQVEGWSDAERVILADGYQALLRGGPLPGSSTLPVRRIRDQRAGESYAVQFPRIVVGYQVLGDAIVVQWAEITRLEDG
jgi:hypothetical protein